MVTCTTVGHTLDAAGHSGSNKELQYILKQDVSTIYGTFTKWHKKLRPLVTVGQKGAVILLPVISPNAHWYLKLFHRDTLCGKSVKTS